MKNISRAILVLLDAPYWVDNRDKSDMWREITIEARQEFDALQRRLKELEWEREMACENTPTKGCDCPGCELSRERASRGEGNST